MSVCWYCYWGWAKPVADIYLRYAPIAGESAMQFGPAHVVWEDENFDHAEDCLKGFDAWVREWNKGENSPEQLAAVRQSLVELVAIPLSIRCPEPQDYDGENPESFPVTSELIARPYGPFAPEPQSTVTASANVADKVKASIHEAQARVIENLTKEER